MALANSVVNYGNVCGALFESTSHSISLGSILFLSRIRKCAFAYDSLIFMRLTGHQLSNQLVPQKVSLFACRILVEAEVVRNIMFLWD